MADDAPGRTITFTVRDQHGKPAAGADMSFRVDGRPGGLIHLGDGAGSGSMSIASAQSSIALELRYGASVQRAVLAPGEDSAHFTVQAVLGLVRQAKIPALARCPDGTANAPCVTCRDGGDIWTICVS